MVQTEEWIPYRSNSNISSFANNVLKIAMKRQYNTLLSWLATLMDILDAQFLSAPMGKPPM
ncbi:hypothetical protein ANCDUO_27128 [Ancylostoma duodenale]|uniref:Uncharacterized protein n=1 Tax=Ancylostoma duodenale TaxID=51022 RepID=A0A0C2FCX7_9BILA|nr:hypothetical protein ANCDUO_27128 [Ancylostoma duodenale]